MDETSRALTAEGDAPDAGPPAPEPPPAKPPFEPATVRRLDPDFVPFQRVIGSIVTAVVSVGLLVVAAIVWLKADLPGLASLFLLPGWLVATLGIAWLFYAWPAVHYRHVSYVLDAEGIEIRTGVWWRQVISVPRSRVQHIDVSQGPMERSYGLGRLVVYTAGTNHSRVELAGLSHAVALALRNYLLPRGSDDAV
jgi:membrane protein YdbS with pleckstrin-like domain